MINAVEIDDSLAGAIRARGGRTARWPVARYSPWAGSAALLVPATTAAAGAWGRLRCLALGRHANQRLGILIRTRIREHLDIDRFSGRARVARGRGESLLRLNTPEFQHLSFGSNPSGSSLHCVR